MRAFIAILFFGWLITLFFPWWGVIIPGIVFGAMFFKSGLKAFFVGFLATGFAWFLQALYIDVMNESILSTRIAEMMGVGSNWIILLTTFLIAAIVGGVATLVGYFLKSVLKPEREVSAV
ncbi:MAG: hypothetical protein R3220_11725 [Balneolaceae bacterium]|nr:hypothetical protein [Balneolaceae bacterium]